MRFATGLLLAAVLSSAALAQDAGPVRGDYEWIAGCVFLKFDAMLPGNIRYADIHAHGLVIITMEQPIAGGAVRSFKATFSRAGDGLTAIEVEGRSPGYHASKVRPLALECSASAPATAGRPARK